MQNLYKYTRYFQPSKTYDHKFETDFIVSMGKLAKEKLVNFPISTMGQKVFTITTDQTNLEKYYDNLVSFAQYFEVKLMWRNIIDTDTFIIYKGIWVIGENLRIDLFLHVVNHFFTGLSGYLKYIEKNYKEQSIKGGWSNVLSYSSYMSNTLLHNIHLKVKELLVQNIRYNNWLENQVMTLHNLDYKNYKSEPKYYHSISRKFHHKRMLL